jgi:hypothetical protein
VKVAAFEIDDPDANEPRLVRQRDVADIIARMLKEAS